MINRKESKQISMDSCLLELLSRGMKTKTRKINQQTIIKNDRKIKNRQKSKSNGKHNTYLPVMLTQVMSNLVPGFRVVLESIPNNPLANCIKYKRNITG